MVGPDMLQGKRWRLQEIVLDQQRIEGVMSAGAFLVLGADGQVYGRGGCNRFFGSYSLDGQEISFGPLASTRMYCQETMAVEDAFFQALGRVVKVIEDDRSITLLSRDGNTILTFTEEDEDAPQEI